MVPVALAGVVASVGVACVCSSGMGDTSMKPGSHSCFLGVCSRADLTLSDIRVIFCAPAFLARSLGVEALAFSATAGLVFGAT